MSSGCCGSMATPVVRTKIIRVGKVLWQACDTPGFAKSIFCVVCDSPVVPAGQSAQMDAPPHLRVLVERVAGGCAPLPRSWLSGSGSSTLDTARLGRALDSKPSMAYGVLFHGALAGIILWQNAAALCLHSFTDSNLHHPIKVPPLIAQVP